LNVVFTGEGSQHTRLADTQETGARSHLWKHYMR